jgi:hypothetical protein
LIWWDDRRKRKALVALLIAIPLTFVIAILIEATYLAGFYGRSVANILLIVVSLGSPLALFGILRRMHKNRLLVVESTLDEWAESHDLTPVEDLNIKDLGDTPILSGEAAAWPIFAWTGSTSAGAPYTLALLGRRKLDRVSNVERVNGLTVVAAELPPDAVRGLPALAVSLDTGLAATGNPSDRCRVFLDRDADRARAGRLLSPEFLGWIDKQKQMSWEQRSDQLIVLDERMVTGTEDLDALLAKARHVRDQYIASI